MVTSPQVSRPSNTALRSAADVAITPDSVLSVTDSWPVVTGLSLPQVMDAVKTIQQSRAAGPVVPALPDAAVAFIEAAKAQPPAAPATAPAGPIDLAPYQAMLDTFNHAIEFDRSGAAPLLPFSTVPAREVHASGLAVPELHAPAFVVKDNAGVSSTAMGEKTDGAVDYLQAQYIYGGRDSVSIGAATSNVFIKGGEGNDALAAQSGRNVLDGGHGSNFLVGGTGVDTYFIDGRSGQATWGTIVGFEPGEIITLWGFDSAVSRLSWTDNEGAAGYTGRTLHADLAGDGKAQVLITIAGAHAADTDRFAMTTGQAGSNPYLAIFNPA